MTNYKEKDLEAFIESHLLQSGYVKRESKDYDKALCLDKELFLHFLQSTQEKDLQDIQKRLGNQSEQELFKRISLQIKEKGIVKALQTHIEIMGIRLHLAYRKPNTTANPQSLENYGKISFLSLDSFIIVRKMRILWIW